MSRSKRVQKQDEVADEKAAQEAAAQKAGAMLNGKENPENDVQKHLVDNTHAAQKELKELNAAMEQVQSRLMQIDKRRVELVGIINNNATQLAKNVMGK